jgi:chromosome segregation ATPase
MSDPTSHEAQIAALEAERDALKAEVARQEVELNSAAHLYGVALDVISKREAEIDALKPEVAHLGNDLAHALEKRNRAEDARDTMYEDNKRLREALEALIKHADDLGWPKDVLDKYRAAKNPAGTSETWKEDKPC